MVRIALSTLALLSGLLPLALSAGPALAQKRVALVVGNSSYVNTAKLPNPSRDAASVAEMFKKAGFDVVTARNDLGNLEFKRAIRDFTAAARGAEIAVFFYAGHGVEINRENYLVPIDAKLASDIDAEDEAVPLDRVVRALEPAKRLRLVILDACRDNPFLQKMERTVAMRSMTNGLGKVEPTTSDTLIAYAAKAGSTAEDGDGSHSPFTTALLNNLTQPGLDVRLAFGKIRDEVMQSTNNGQEPFMYGSLGGSTVSLVPAPAVAKVPAVASDPNLAMRGDYEMAERVGTAEAWDSFLAVYKEGLYASLARAQRAKLAAAQGGANSSIGTAPAPKKDTVVAMATPAEPPVAVARAFPQVEAPTAPEQQRPSRDEQRQWDKIKDSADRGAIRKFIERFPSSPLALTAQHRLDILERAAQERDEKARLEREAAQRADQERRAKAAEAEREKAEREAARRRDIEEQRRQAAETAEHQRAEREAAKQRAAEEQAAKAREAAAKAQEARELARQRAAEEQAAKQAKEAEGQPAVGTPEEQAKPTQSAQPTPAERETDEGKAASREAAEREAAQRRQRARAEQAEREAAERRAQQRREAEREEREAARRAERAEEQKAERAERAAAERAERAAAGRAAAERASERAERAAAERRNKAEARSKRSREREVVVHRAAPARSAPPRARAEAAAVPRQSYRPAGGGGSYGGGGGGGASMTGVGF